ncbi:helix-turn-helix domain-containing protein [Ensifer aridi]|uniref:helix-turn-helix domain-containing protein n=1 Tax=Ensifer aridi TaxID=1708715 RepID=UPI00111C08F9
MKPQEFTAIIAGLESQGMTPSEIAREAGLSRMTVWRIAKGETSRPSYETVTRLKSVVARRTAAMRRPALVFYKERFWNVGVCLTGSEPHKLRMPSLNATSG